MSPPAATFSQRLSRTSPKLGIVSCSFTFPVTSFNKTFGLPSELSQAKTVCPHLCDKPPYTLNLMSSLSQPGFP